MTIERKHEMGPGGTCMCPACEETIEHKLGIPCQEERCPDCGAKMLREGSHHHKLWLEKKRSLDAAKPE